MLRKKLTFTFLLFLLVGWQPVIAQDQDVQATLQKMQDLLEQQQKELDEQRKELAAQRLLIKQLQGSQKSVATTAPVPDTSAVPEVVYPDSNPTDDIQPDPDAPVPDASQSGQQQAVLAMASGDKITEPDVNTQGMANVLEDRSNTNYDKNFPGAWYLPGTTAAMKIGGFVNLSVVNSFDPMLIPDRFIVGSIPPDGEQVPGAKEGTEVSAKQTRVNLEYREQTKLGEIRAFVEGDFQDTGQNSGDVYRLRHAFGQFRTFLAGKTWTTLMDIEAQPEEVDIEGINGQVLVRNAQVRWFPRFGKQMSLKIAMEDPFTDVINGEGQRGRADLIATMDRMPLGPLGRWNYRVGMILRDLSAVKNVGPRNGNDSPNNKKNTTGWGITTGGRQPMSRWGESDYLLWQITYGEGIGHYLTDLETMGGGDAVFDPAGKLHALPVFAGYVSYQHLWPRKWKFLSDWPGILRSNFTVSWVDIDNYDFQRGSAYNYTLRASGNLIYVPTQDFSLGVEYLWGRRVNKNGSEGSANQLQFSARYSF